jgi:hypothetical protein
VTGMEFKITAKNVLALASSERSGLITIIANETGGIVEIPITVTIDETFFNQPTN